MEDRDKMKMEDVASTLEDLLKAAADLDRLIKEAADAGFDSGRVYGIVEAYNFLISRGQKIPANMLRSLLEDETAFMKSQGEA